MTGNTERIPLAESNFLVPNGTFFVELIAFGIIVWILGKFVIPPINRAMQRRQDAIRDDFAELDEAKAKAEAAENEYREQLVEARHEAAKIREQAREEGALIIAEMREKAQAESERILQLAHQQVEAERRQVVAQLRTEVGTMATTLAGRIVGESLEDDERRDRTVERFISNLEESEPVDQPGAR
jgi:F-type H+-transporting ATPase subunit b